MRHEYWSKIISSNRQAGWCMEETGNNSLAITDCHFGTNAGRLYFDLRRVWIAKMLLFYVDRAKKARRLCFFSKSHGKPSTLRLAFLIQGVKMTSVDLTCPFFIRGIAMTKKEIAEKLEITHQETLRIVQGTFDAIIETLVEEGRIELRNFGVFEVKRRAARLARNPKTGEKVKVPKKCVVVFKPGKEMEEKVAKLVKKKKK